MHLSQKLTPTIANLNVKHETIKLLENDIGEYPGDLGYSSDF